MSSKCRQCTSKKLKKALESLLLNLPKPLNINWREHVGIEPTNDVISATTQF